MHASEKKNNLFDHISGGGLYFIKKKAMKREKRETLKFSDLDTSVVQIILLFYSIKIEKETIDDYSQYRYRSGAYLHNVELKDCIVNPFARIIDLFGKNIRSVSLINTRLDSLAFHGIKLNELCITQDVIDSGYLDVEYLEKLYLEASIKGNVLGYFTNYLYSLKVFSAITPDLVFKYPLNSRGLEILIIPFCRDFDIFKSTSDLKNLKIIDISGMEMQSIKDLSILNAATELQELYAIKTRFNNKYTGLKFYNLKILDVTGCRYLTGNPFEYLVSLEELYIRDCSLLTDNSISHLVNLKVIYAVDCISLVNPLDRMTKLEQAYLDGCKNMNKNWFQKFRSLKLQRFGDIKYKEVESKQYADIHSALNRIVIESFSVGYITDVRDNDSSPLQLVRVIHDKKNIKRENSTWLRGFDDEDKFTIAVDSFSKICGVLVFLEDFDEKEKSIRDRIRVQIIAVLPEYQGLSIGRKLIEWLFDKYSNIDNIVLASIGYRRTDEFYERLGFINGWIQRSRYYKLKQERQREIETKCHFD